MPSIIDGSASATFQTPLPLLQGGTGSVTGNVTSSQVAGALNATGSAPLYACRAWVNFNGTGTVAIRASGNVSSITDNGTGNYTVNFTTAMQDANYNLVGAGGRSADGEWRGVSYKGPLTTSINVKTSEWNGTSIAYTDGSEISISVFR